VRAPVLAILFATGVWAQADLILSNGKIITVDERFSIAQAIAIRGSRIAAVGTDQAIARLAGPNTRRINLKGKAVIPGLIDNHMHLLRAAATWTKELRFDGVESRKQAIEMLRAKVKAAGPGEWVFNIGGWTHQQFADDPRLFTRAELDTIAPNSPVSTVLFSGLRQRDRNGQILEENRAGIAEIPEPSFVNRSPGIGHRNPHTGRALTGVEIDSALDEKEFGAATPRVTFQAN